MFCKTCLRYVLHQLIFLRTPLVHLEGRSEEENRKCGTIKTRHSPKNHKRGM